MQHSNKSRFALVGLLAVLMIIWILSGTMLFTPGTGKPQAATARDLKTNEETATLPVVPEPAASLAVHRAPAPEILTGETDEAMPSSRIVVLVHGFAKTGDDMKFIEEGLEERGYEVYSVNLPTTFGSVEDCALSMASQLSRVIPKYRRVDFVTHSMGALITRTYLKAHPLPGLRKCVFIAPPHKGSAISDFLNHIPFYSSLFRPIKGLKTDSENLGKDLYLMPGTVEVGVIAGSKNDKLAGRLLLSGKNDGRVEVESTECADMKERKVLPYNHHKIHHNKESLDAVDSFLRSGTFGR